MSRWCYVCHMLHAAWLMLLYDDPLRLQLSRTHWRQQALVWLTLINRFYSIQPGRQAGRQAQAQQKLQLHRRHRQQLYARLALLTFPNCRAFFAVFVVLSAGPRFINSTSMPALGRTVQWFRIGGPPFVSVPPRTSSCSCAIFDFTFCVRPGTKTNPCSRCRCTPTAALFTLCPQKNIYVHPSIEQRFDTVPPITAGTIDGKSRLWILGCISFPIKAYVFQFLIILRFKIQYP